MNATLTVIHYINHAIQVCPKTTMNIWYKNTIHVNEIFELEKEFFNPLSGTHARWKMVKAKNNQGNYRL